MNPILHDWQTMAPEAFAEAVGGLPDLQGLVIRQLHCSRRPTTTAAAAKSCGVSNRRVFQLEREGIRRLYFLMAEALNSHRPVFVKTLLQKKADSTPKRPSIRVDYARKRAKIGAT